MRLDFAAFFSPQKVGLCVIFAAADAQIISFLDSERSSSSTKIIKKKSSCQFALFCLVYVPLFMAFWTLGLALLPMIWKCTNIDTINLNGRVKKASRR